MLQILAFYHLVKQRYQVKKNKKPKIKKIKLNAYQKYTKGVVS